MAVKLVLLHSPLLGPGSWRVLAPLLRERGFEVAVPDYSGVMAGRPPYYAKMVEIARQSIDDPSAGAILIAHSGAGALVPAIADTGLAGCAIFVDALLPHPGVSWFKTAPEALASRLTQLTREGRVPPWHRWWPNGAIETFLNDPASYSNFVTELKELPLAFLNEPAPTIELPRQLGCAYLRLGSGYEAEAAVVERRGWPVSRLDLHHLAMLTHGREIAGQLEALARKLKSRPST